MEIQIDEQLLNFMKEIEAEGKSRAQWAEVESCDWFQSDSYCGGYDADDEAFCFSYYHPDGREFWFQFSLEDVKKIVVGQIRQLTGRKASK